MLSSTSQDKSTPLQQLTPSLLIVKLNGFGFSTPLADSSAQRLESARLYKVGEGKVGGELKLSLSSLSIAVSKKVVGARACVCVWGGGHDRSRDYSQGDASAIAPPTSVAVATTPTTTLQEDLYSLGLCFLQLLLGALAEDEVVVKEGGLFSDAVTEKVSVPEVTQQGLERQIEDVFNGDIGQVGGLVGDQRNPHSAITKWRYIIQIAQPLYRYNI